jgi:glycerophosphoryl diester phosphodiesterase
MDAMAAHPTHLPRPIGFAHRGARAHARENTIEAFSLALRLGATGIESDVWLTADGVAVLDHDGVVGTRLRRRAIRDLRRDDLPEHIPTLAELFTALGTDYELSLDVKDPEAGPAAVEAALAADPTLPSRLWMCDVDHDRLVALREIAPHVRLVDSTRLARLKEGPERRAAQLRELGIDALNLHHSDWTVGLVTLVHRFGRCAFGWDAQFERTIGALLHMGADGVYSDHVDRMTDVLGRHGAGAVAPEDA